MAVQINVAANQAALISSIQAGVQAYNQRFANNNQINLNINARAFSQPLGRITGDVKDFEAALAASNARVIAFGASTAVLGGVIRSFKELASVTIDVEKNLADINRVFGLSTSQLQKFSTELFNVSKQTASTFDNASKAALEFSRQGLKAEETLQRTKDALTLTRLAGIGTANAVDALTSTVNGFAATGVTTSQILNKLIAVEQDFAVGAGDLAEALSRTGQAAQEAGVSLDQLNALVTSAQQSTARGGAVIGNALKTIFTRLQRTETLDQLEAFNISVRDVQGNILPAVTILQNFAGAYKNLADAQRAQLSEQVAGVYQVNILKAIVNDLNQSQGVYAGALQRGASATNEAEIATAKLNKTLDALLSQTATSAQQLANNIGKVTFEPLARYGTEQLKSFVENMNEILEGEGIGSTFANGLLKGIRNILAGPGAIAAFFTLFKLIQNSFSFLTQALPQIAGITTETQNRKNIEQSILQIMQQQGPISQALAGTMGNQAAQAQLLLQLARQQTAEYQQQSALAKQLAAQLAGQGVKVAGARGLQVTRSGGYVPTATKLAEVVGAKAGGYSPGRVVPSPVGGVMNTAEDVKYIPGFAQPFINPPAGSKAGRAHRQNAIKRTGVDPYMASGFIPNFGKTIKSLNAPNLNKYYDMGAGGIFDLQAIDIENLSLEKGYNEYRDEGENIYLLAKQIFDSKGLSAANAYIKDITNGYGKDLNEKYFTKKTSSTINPIVGALAERDVAMKYGYKKLKDYEAADFSIPGGGFAEVKVLSKNIADRILKIKALTAIGIGSGIKYKNNDVADIVSSNIKYYLSQKRKSFNGFIPNFAPPASAIRVPWFRKFGNPAFDSIQPTLGISRASDTDTFRSSQFRSKAFEKAATDGDPNIFAPLYEDFIFKALQLVSQPKIKDQLIRGYVNQPGTDQKQSAFDAFLGDVGLEFKGYPKTNLTGSISKNLNDKYERYVKANPAGAAKIKESIIAFNEIGDKNQLVSEFGKNFIQLAGTSYSEMVKNNPDLVKGLSAETNMLLQRYVKDPAFLAMSAARGFIPNFADLIPTEIDAILQPISKSRTIQSKQLFGKTLDSDAIRYLNATSVEKLNKFLSASGYLDGALGVDFPDHADKKFLFTKNKGFIPNFAKFKSRFGTATLGKTDPIDLEFFGKTLGRKIKPSDIVSIEDLTTKGKGNASNLYGDIANSIKGKGGIFGYALAQNRSVDSSKVKDPLARLKAKYPQIAKRIGLGGETFISGDYGQNIVKASTMQDLIKYQDQILKMVDPAVLTLKSFANGFIPNFAYKQAVMGLEENMSGNKAIFDTKPFPHIRNSSQPTFSSAIADHGGLGNALSDSMRGQKAAGLMSKGFIPNFGPIRSFKRKAQKNQSQNTQSSFDPSQLESEVEKYAKQALTDIKNGFKSTIDKIKSIFIKVDSSVSSEGIDQINSLRQRTFRQNKNTQEGDTNNSQKNSRFTKFSENLSKASTAIAIVGPTIAGFAEQAVFGNKKRTEMTATERTLQSGLSTGLSAVSTGAGIGAAFGLPGAIVGGAAGALVGFVSALDAAKLSAEDLAEMTDAQKQNTQQNVSAGQKYIQAQEQYAKLLASGASSDKLELASKNLSDSFNQITDVKLADELSKTKGGVEALNSVLSKFETDKNILTAALSFAAGVKGGKVQGGVQIGERVKELKSIGLSKEQISQLQSFKLEKENTSRFIPPAGLGPGTRLNVETVKESSLKTAQQIAENIAKSAIGNKGTAEEIKAFQESILQLLFGENKDELLKQLSSGNQFTNNIIENARKEGNLLKVKNDLSLSILKQIGEANAQLEQDDFGRKLLDEINNFKFSLAEGILSPLSIAAEKSKAQRTKTIAEGQAKLTELNLNFVKENQEKFLKLTSSSDVIQNKIRPALEKAQTGDLSGLEEILQESSITGQSPFDPAIINDLKKIYEEFNRSVDKQNKNNVNQLKLTDLQGRIEQIRAKTTEFQATLLQKQIQLLADQERVEATRKTNAELEIDAIERRMADQGNFLGRGVVGKAESKIALRNEITRKKLIDLEISRSKSAQSDYQSLIEKQQINLTRSAAASELEGRPSQALSLREQARNLKSIDITNSETLSQAIEQLKTSSFADPTLDTERVRTLEKLKSIQNDIANGKLREEEITKRINAEELRNAKRSTSIAYGFKEGFDIIRDEADTGLNKLARDTPILFRDGMVDAIKATIRETDNLNDALLGIAAKFLDTFSTQLMSTGVSKIISGSGLGNLFGMQTGGLIRAQSGMYISGTGSGDKYPALLENGEYVLNRNAVMAMGGPAALDTLNFSAAPRFATGGQFNKQFDTIAGMEANMTEMGLENSPLYKEMTDAAKQKAEEDRRKRLASKQQRAAMIGSLVAAAATVAIGAGVSNVAKNVEAKENMSFVEKMNAQGGPRTEAEYFKQQSLVGKGVMTASSPIAQARYIGPTPQTGFRSILSGPTTGQTWYQKAGNILSNPFRRQIGGSIGSRLSDTIPGYMEGGLYNAPLIKKYSAGLQSGGSSLMAAGNSSSTINNNTSANNSFNFNTTVERNGTIKMGSNTTSYEQQDIELSKNLNNRIYAAVGEVIRKEKQFGGSLAAIRNS